MKQELKLAVEVARSLGMPETWANLQTIRISIECEANFSGVSLEDAANVILKAAKQPTRGPEYSCPAEWELRDISRLNLIDRFWFEDMRWRAKIAYVEFRFERGLACQ